MSILELRTLFFQSNIGERMSIIYDKQKQIVIYDCNWDSTLPWIVATRQRTTNNISLAFDFVNVPPYLIRVIASRPFFLFRSFLVNGFSSGYGMPYVQSGAGVQWFEFVGINDTTLHIVSKDSTGTPIDSGIGSTTFYFESW